MTTQSDGWQFYVELVHLYRDMMRVTEQATGMSQSRLEIMHELFHAEEMSQADLQQHLGVEGAVVSRIVKQLEAAGMVTRRPDPRDNRFTLVALSPEARRRHADIEGARFKETFGAHIFEGLSEADRDNLMQMLKHISENVRTARESGRFLLS
jgi:DNA-binding MarR family transcriptional regulator